MNSKYSLNLTFGWKCNDTLSLKGTLSDRDIKSTLVGHASSGTKNSDLYLNFKNEIHSLQKLSKLIEKKKKKKTMSNAKKLNKSLFHLNIHSFLII